MSLEQFTGLDFARDVYFRWFSPSGVERFDFVGIMEEYDRSLELFRRLICPDIQLDTTLRNHNPNRRGNFYDLGPELRRKILELNQRDAYVYLDGVRRFRSLSPKWGFDLARIFGWLESLPTRMQSQCNQPGSVSGK